MINVSGFFLTLLNGMTIAMQIYKIKKALKK